MSNDAQFIDAESYSGSGQQDKISFRLIVLQHLKHISILTSKELCGGYWQEKPIQIGTGGAIIRTYVEDSREAYCNAVNYLSDILFPHFDNEMKIKEEELDNELEESLDQFKGVNSDGEEVIRKDAYRKNKVRIKRKLFRALNRFLERTKYMEGKVFEESV